MTASPYSSCAKEPPKSGIAFTDAVGPKIVVDGAGHPGDGVIRNPGSSRPDCYQATTYRRHLPDTRIVRADDTPSPGLEITVTVLMPPGLLPPSDPEAQPDVGTVEQVRAMPAASIATELITGVADAGLAQLMCDELQRHWAGRCPPQGVVTSIDFSILGSDEMTVDEYLATYSLDTEFLTTTPA